MSGNEDSGELNWTEDYRVRFQHLDHLGKAKLTSMFELMQETAWRHAEELGFGYFDLLEENLLIALAKQHVKLISRPRYGDTISVRTTLAGTSRIFFYRNFRVYGGNSELILKANTIWTCLDVKSRRPQRLTKVTGKFGLPRIGEPSRSTDVKIKLPQSPSRKYRRTVRHSDLDVHGHVNNNKYVDWILDGMSLDFLSSHKLQKFEIEYRSELSLGQSLCVKTYQEGMTFFHGIIPEDGEQVLARAKSKWSPGS